MKRGCFWLRPVISKACCVLAALSMQAVVGACVADDLTCQLELKLVDQATGQELPGIVRCTESDGEPVPLEPLLNRGYGIERRGGVHDWFVLPAATTIEVPAERLEFQALSGLETERSEVSVDLTGKGEAELAIKLVRFFDPLGAGQVAGNTHLHLRRMSKEQADRYLREVPLADGLDIVFLSYLERAIDDLEYTSNNYTPDDLRRLSTELLRFGHGEEHRHNFEGYGEGYGHILLLDIPHIIRPVSIGPGIMREGTDAPPLQQGIDEAKAGGGTIVWAHDRYGLEDIPNWLTGRVDANNIFDGGTRGSYKDSFYRYLNIGLKVPFSSGTDWFIYDFSRAYVLADRALTPREWLAELAAGRSYITNGPLLEFHVDGHRLGDTIELDQPAQLKIEARCVGRIDFQRIELVRNGSVVETQESQRVAQHFVADATWEIEIDAPCWLALRCPPPPVANDPTLQEPVPLNEYDGPLFAHTSPIYVTLAGEMPFDSSVAAELHREMQEALHHIADHAVFAEDEEREQVQAVYSAALGELEARMAAHSR